MKIKHIPFAFKLNIIILVFLACMTVLSGRCSYDKQEYDKYFSETIK